MNLFYLAMFLLGVIAGLRAVTPVAAVSWGALARALGKDLPAALVEGLVAVAGAALVVGVLL